MIKHVLMIKLIDNNQENREKAKEVFLSMDGKVPCIRALSAGTDFLQSERSYDVILEVTLDSPEALEEYQTDPYHVSQVKPYIQAVRSGSVTVDYELD